MPVEIQKAGKRSNSYPLRLHNIKWIKNLPRERLSFEVMERQICLLQPSTNHELYIQYPGKESQRPKEPRPWDFRPKLFNRQTNSYCADLSFDAIWGEMEDKLLPFRNTPDNIIPKLSFLLYKMAFMIDHQKRPGTLRTKIGTGVTFENEQRHDLGILYLYLPQEDELNSIAQRIPMLCGMDFKSFIYYIELIAWNEDCKYWYRNFIKAGEDEEETDWIGDTGRINTLLTIINFIGLISGKIKQSKSFVKFARTGVSAIQKDDILQLCPGLITPAE